MVNSIRVAEFNWKKGDLAPSIIYDLTRVGANADVVDLSGATVKFIMRPQAPGSTVKINAAATIVNNTNPARVRYDPVAGDTDTSGQQVGEWQVTYATGEVETFPNARFISILIRDDLAD